MYIAHLYKENHNAVTEQQSIRSHLEGSAETAIQRLCSRKFRHLVHVAAMLHDMGKYSDRYQEYLRKIAMDEPVIRGSVNHTFAGVIYILEKYHAGSGYERLASEMIAYAIGAHHGLFDCVDMREKNGFQHRMDTDREDLEYELAKKRYFEDIEESSIEQEFQEAAEEVKAFCNTLQKDTERFPSHAGGGKTEEKKFTAGLLARMITSAVMYGDRRNTAEFMQGQEQEPQLIRKEFWSRQAAYLEDRLADQFAGSAATPINQERQKISDQCREFANHGDGIYKISVPTGAGKTLSTLRYAYHLAENTGKQRVIMVIPLLSVLEQNRKVIRDFTEAKDRIGEHHSDVVAENGNQLDELTKSQLACEFWDEPVIITTMYQFLMNLFSDRTACVTRMSSYADSVIVFDEIQSIPKKDIHLFNLAMNFLHQFFHTTVLLSSATQPELGVTQHPIRYTDPIDVIPKPDIRKTVFKRTEIDLSKWKRPMSAEEIANFSISRIRDINSLLIICNTKAEARAVYRILLAAQTEENYQLFQLSTSMCQKHREERLQTMNEMLAGKTGSKVICAATQMVEAGVDISFEAVIRVMAGLDNLIQAAGRCNRSGEFGRICKVYLVRYREEKLAHLDEIKRSQDAMVDLLSEFQKHPEKYGHDICGEESIRYFYRDLFQNYGKDGLFDYKINQGADTLLELLSTNSKYTKRSRSEERFCMQQAFKEAGRQFKIYDEDTVDVIVPYLKGNEIIRELQTEKACSDIGYRKGLFRQAGQYAVRLWKDQLDTYVKRGIIHLAPNAGDFYFLDPAYYHAGENGEDIGFAPD